MEMGDGNCEGGYSMRFSLPSPMNYKECSYNPLVDIYLTIFHFNIISPSSHPHLFSQSFAMQLITSLGDSMNGRVEWNITIDGRVNFITDFWLIGKYS